MRRKRTEPGGKPSVVAIGVGVAYGRGAGKRPVLEDVNLQAEQGSLTQVVGEPGSGKSTLLRILAALQKPTSGIVTVSGTPTSRLRPRRLAKLARTQVAPLFDDTTLIPSLSVMENLMLPGDLRRATIVPRELDQVVDGLGLKPILNRRPHQLSESEAQLVRCGRLLLTPAPIVVADEPLRDLSSEQAAAVQDALRRVAFEDGKVVIASGQKPWELSANTHVWKLSGGRLTEWAGGSDSVPVLREVDPASVVLEVEEPVSPATLRSAAMLSAPLAMPPSGSPRAPLSAEQQEVVTRAQKILDSLPGQVAPGP